MPNDIDDMLAGGDTSQVSQTQEGQESDSNKETPLEQQTPEEIEFNSLSGSVQERIRKLANKARTAQQEAELLRQQSLGGQQLPPAPGSNFVDPQEQAALQTLANKGVATDEKVKKQVSDAENRILWNLRQQTLEGKYQGQNGEPQYVREEVEDYIRSHPQYQGYDAEDVFRYKMFPDEFLTSELKRRQGQQGGKTQSSSLRPTGTRQQTEALTPEYINDRADPKKHADGLQWYEEHLDEINATLAKQA